MNAHPRGQAEVARVEDASVVLGRRAVLRRVSLTVTQGECVALLGANGSGKSTLVRALVGLTPLAAGSVELFGRPVGRFRDWGRVGFVPQRVSAAGGVPATVEEVVTSGRTTRGAGLFRTTAADQAAVGRALATVGLAERARESVGRLSGGQQQRVLIARALTNAPELLILDEPMAGVDLDSQLSLAHTLRGLRAAGTTILIVLHEPGALVDLLTRAVVLRDGEVVRDGGLPRPTSHHADPEHDHVHPHGDQEREWRLML